MSESGRSQHAAVAPAFAAANSAAPSSAAPSSTTRALQPVREAFGRIAGSYDNDFTDSLIGRLQRGAVWRHLDELFAAGDRVLDLGCGTGADAMHLARRGVEVEAVDVSEQMIAEARRKISAAGLAGRITAKVLAIEDLSAWDRQSCLSTLVSHAEPQLDTSTDPASEHEIRAGSGRAGNWHEGEIRAAREAEIRTGHFREGEIHAGDSGDADRQDCLSHFAFDGVISNFGAVNCVPQLRPLARDLGRLVRPGGHLVLVLLGRFCAWETVFYALRGRFDKAARRWRNGGRASVCLDGSAGFPVYYRPVREVIDAFRPEFRLLGHSGIGILVPPSYLEAQARRVPGLMALAATADRAVTNWPIARAAADHTLLVFRRERAI